MTIICSGSLAIDRLMNYPAVFADSIIADKIDMLNISFVVDTLKLAYGGTAGNIAYNLGLLGEKPLLAGSLGDDPDGAEYFKRLAAQGFPLQAVKVHPGSATAGCTVATDRNNNQINFFHPGAMLLPSGFDPAALAQPYVVHKFW
ncbi:MAG: PfkB family carbohydrate kinase, partial [Candidatus Adiutrix sp.]|nr:PfkB family carbohydrate kinase [Candidatus Adiutrix sp.]